jgi:hypothetical protein
VAREVTIDEVFERLGELRDEVHDMSRTFVDAKLYESQRGDTGRRIGDIERDVAKSASDLENLKIEIDRRFRQSVNLGLGSLGSALVGVFLLLLNLVAK